MKIIVKNKTERIWIEQVCDLALKSDGIGIVNATNLIMQSIEDEPVKEVKLPMDTDWETCDKKDLPETWEYRGITYKRQND